MQQNSSPWKSITNIYQSINKTPEKKTNGGEILTGGSPLPNTFKFTPTKGKKLYPHLNPPDQVYALSSSPMHDNYNESYINKDNQTFINAMDSIQKQLFSSNISNKVMDEFSSRYEKVREEKIHAIQDFNQSTTNDDLNRRQSGRFSITHRNRFNRMESIAFHYAAKRSEKEQEEERKKILQKQKQLRNNENINHIQRKLIESENLNLNELDLNNNEVLTPSDKRLNLLGLESASKRLRLDENNNFKEIDSSPTKSIYEKEQLKNYYSKDTNTDSQHHHVENSNQKIRQSNNQTHQNNHYIPNYLQPTKASLQRSTSSRSISPSKSTRTLSKGLNELDSTPDLKPISTSTSISNNNKSSSMYRGFAKSKSPSISPSRAISNLNEILSSSPDKPIEPKFVKPTITKSKIPRSKTLNIDEISVTSASKTSISRSKTSTFQQPQQRSKTLPNSSSTPNNLSTSSSIPRLAKLVNIESRVKQVSKHNQSSPKKWHY